MITLQEAKSLRHGDILYHTTFRNVGGTPQRWKVNGMIKTWVRSPEKVRVPVKHGQWDFDYVTEKDFGLVALSPEEALKK